MSYSRVLSLAGTAVLAAGLAACASSDPYGPNNYPVSSVNPNPAGTAFVEPSTAPTYVAPQAYAAPTVEYGRVTNVALVSQGTASNNGNTVAGTVIGGVVGGVLGNTIGHGAGRAAATVLGAAAGAAVGNNVASRQYPQYAGPVYRIWVQTDSGLMRTYDVTATNLRPGDRVRIDNGMIYMG
jgi:outer membrane lipoprotein SlyB